MPWKLNGNDDGDSCGYDDDSNDGDNDDMEI